MALEIDLEKAYDMLDQNYIQACLQKMGFANDMPLAYKLISISPPFTFLLELPILVMSSKFNTSSIGRYLGFQHIYYECLAMRDGLAHVLHHGWRNIIIEYDSV